MYLNLPILDEYNFCFKDVTNVEVEVEDTAVKDPTLEENVKDKASISYIHVFTVHSD